MSRNMVAATIDAFGDIDVLVNDAAILVKADFLDLDPADFDRVLRVNLKGAFLCGQAVARHMVERVKAGGDAGRDHQPHLGQRGLRHPRPGALFGVEGRAEPAHQGDGAVARPLRDHG